MSAKHTPGPWEADCGVVNATATDGTGDLEEIIQEGYNLLSADESAANLQLCAAAPELLAALKHLIRNGGPGDFPQAEAAIAKAEGRS